MAYDYSDILEKAKEIAEHYNPEYIDYDCSSISSQYIFTENQLNKFISYILGLK